MPTVRKRRKNKVTELDNLDVKNQTTGQGGDIQDQPQESEEGEEGESQEEKNEIEESTGGGGPGGVDQTAFNDIAEGEEDEDPEVKTDASLEEKLKDLIGHSEYPETLYLEIPNLNLDTIIAPNKEVHDICDEFYENVISTSPDDAYLSHDDNYEKFKKSAQKKSTTSSKSSSAESLLVLMLVLLYLGLESLIALNSTLTNTMKTCLKR